MADEIIKIIDIQDKIFNYLNQMCSRGVYQLSKLSLFFCDFGGSSTGVRSLLMSSKIKQFINNNPQIKIDFICKRNHHPYVAGSYINGYAKNVPLRSLSEEDVLQKLTDMRNQLGRTAFKSSGVRVHGAVKSIQGKWAPNMFNKYPVAELQQTHQIPWSRIGTKQKLVENKQQLKQADQTNKALKFRPISDGNFNSNKGSQA